MQLKGKAKLPTVIGSSMLQYINVIANLFRMRFYFNELRWKIIRANNLLQFIHQVSIEFRLRKSLAQERFKPNLEFRYQIIVSSIKFRKGFAKFMISIAVVKVRKRANIRNWYNQAPHLTQDTKTILKNIFVCRAPTHQSISVLVGR